MEFCPVESVVKIDATMRVWLARLNPHRTRVNRVDGVLWADVSVT
jgi:hypothetical protein